MTWDVGRVASGEVCWSGRLAVFRPRLCCEGSLGGELLLAIHKCFCLHHASMQTVTSSTAPSPTPSEPELAPPGAGLPFLERLVGRGLIAWGMRNYGKEATDAVIRSERDAILSLTAQGGDEQNARRVLIPRLRGMEDSSRHWSVFMVLEHLAIVNGGVGAAMRELAAGRVPSGEVRTADVKPRAQAGPESLDTFTRSCDLVMRVMAEIADPRSTPRHAHPWFGPLDAGQWHHMVAFHIRLHRRQIEAIRTGDS